MRRIQHMVGVGRTTAPVDDTGAAQTVQVQTLAGITVDKVPIVQLFGFSSVMPHGSDVTFLNVAGDSSAMMAVGTGHQASRQKNTPAGGAVVYDQAGTTLLLSNDGNATLTLTGTFTIKIGGMTAVFSAAGLTVTGGAVSAAGEVTAMAGAAHVTLSQHHGHTTSSLPPTPGT